VARDLETGDEMGDFDLGDEKDIPTVDPNSPYFASIDSYGKTEGGPSVRLEYAAQFMAAFIASGTSYTKEKLLDKVLDLADGLIDQHNKTRNRKLSPED
jgi:hypothetical protein